MMVVMMMMMVMMFLSKHGAGCKKSENFFGGFFATRVPTEHEHPRTPCSYPSSTYRATLLWWRNPEIDTRRSIILA